MWSCALAKVAFTIPGDVPSELAAQVPIDVFDRQLVKAKAGPAGVGFDLEAGVYGARAMLPDGRELGVAFRVEEGAESLLFDLSYVGAPAPAPDVQPGDAPAGNATVAGAVAGFGVRVLTGNPFLALQRAGPWQATSPDQTFLVLGGLALQAVEVRRAGLADERHVMVPVQPDEQRRVTFSAEDPRPHIAFDDPELELLVGYLGAGMVGAAADMARSRTGLARRALAEERRPMGATLGAYVLLQAAGPLAVAEFTQDLPERFPWLPDARVLRAEVRARQGEHLGALSDLMALRKIGPPLFSSGLSYALNRMRQYALPIARQRLKADARRFTEFAAQLDWLAARTDFDRPILTYRPPAAPSLSTLTADAVQSTLRSAAGLFDGLRRKPEPSS